MKAQRPDLGLMHEVSAASEPASHESSSQQWSLTTKLAAGVGGSDPDGVSSAVSSAGAVSLVASSEVSFS